MKYIGIAADAYKVARFEKELKDQGYTFETTPGKDFTAIKVAVEDKDFQDATKKIHALCVKVEAHFKRSN
jgi:hypothetical protein